MDIEFTPRNVAKYAVKVTIYTKMTKLAEETITDCTQFEDDDLTVKISSRVVGWYVSHKLKPITDKMVDKTADFINKKRGIEPTPEETTE